MPSRADNIRQQIQWYKDRPEIAKSSQDILQQLQTELMLEESGNNTPEAMASILGGQVLGAAAPQYGYEAPVQIDANGNRSDGRMVQQPNVSRDDDPRQTNTPPKVQQPNVSRDEFIDPGTAIVIAGWVSKAIGAINGMFGKGRRAADAFVDSVQDRAMNVVQGIADEIRGLEQSPNWGSPETMDRLAEAWARMSDIDTQFRSAADYYINSGDPDMARVGNQALSTWDGHDSDEWGGVKGDFLDPWRNALESGGYTVNNPERGYSGTVLSPRLPDQPTKAWGIVGDALLGYSDLATYFGWPGGLPSPSDRNGGDGSGRDGPVDIPGGGGGNPPVGPQPPSGGNGGGNGGGINIPGYGNDQSGIPGWLQAILLGTDIGTNLYSGASNAGAIERAAELQAGSADKASELQRLTEQEQLALLERMYNQGRDDQLPFLEAGKNQLRTIEDVLSRISPEQLDAMASTRNFDPRLFADQQGSGGGTYTPQTFDRDFVPESFSEEFAPPTYEDLMNNPEYQFLLEEGEKAIERSASAKGSLQSGGTMKDLTRFSQGLASTKYGEMFDRYTQGYLTREGVFRGNESARERDFLNESDIFSQNEDRRLRGFLTNESVFRADEASRERSFDRETQSLQDIWNRITGVAGVGSNTASNTAAQGQDFAGQSANIALSSRQLLNDLLTGGASARSAGVVGANQARTEAVSSIGDILNNYMLAKQFGLY